MSIIGVPSKVVMGNPDLNGGGGAPMTLETSREDVLAVLAMFDDRDGVAVFGVTVPTKDCLDLWIVEMSR